VLSSLIGRQPRYLVAEVDTSTGVERITRMLAPSATASQVREFVGEEASALGGDVLVVDPRQGVRLYALPLIEGTIARWDLLLAAHRRRSIAAAATQALAAMGERPSPETEPLVQWLVAGADDTDPVASRRYVPEMATPLTAADWFGVERRAQVLARVLPVAHEVYPDDPHRFAHYLASRLMQP
jgi:hypothetical protein